MSVESSQIITAVIAVLYVCCCGVMMYYASNEYCTNLHKVTSLMSTALIGSSVLLFRIMRGQQTRAVKYGHMFLHTVAIIIFIVGLIPSLDLEYMQELHPVPGYFIMVFISLQFLVALFIFTYLYDNPRVRLIYAKLHDVFGIWIFICLTGCILTAFPSVQTAYYPTKNKMYNICGFGGGMLVLFALLCPFFEWELVGNI